MQCCSFSITFVAHHALYDPGRCDWCCRLHLILMVRRVDSCRVLSAFGRSWIFRRSSRRIVQPPGVDDLCCSSSGLLHCDFRHIQLLDVRKLLDSSLTHLLWFKQTSNMSTLGSTAFLVPVHNLLSPSITIFGICRQNDYSARVHVRGGSVPIWSACQPAPCGIRCWTGPQSPPTVSVCRLYVGKTTRSSGVQQTLPPILSRAASILRIPRSHLHCDICTVSSSSRVQSTSACWASRWVSVSTILLSSLVPACSAGPRLRDKISVWWSTWHSEPASQVHFSLIGESLPASLEIAEVARTTAGRPLSPAPLESTWSLRFLCWHAVLPQLSYPQRVAHVWFELGYSHCPTASLSLLTGLTPASPELPAPRFPLGALRSTRQQVSIPVFRDAITVPLFREATILAPLPCCECMRWEVTYTHTCFALGECRIRVTHVHTRSDCVHTRDDTVRLNNASRFVRNQKVKTSLHFFEKINNKRKSFKKEKVQKIKKDMKSLKKFEN